MHGGQLPGAEMRPALRHLAEVGAAAALIGPWEAGLWSAIGCPGCQSECPRCKSVTGTSRLFTFIVKYLHISQQQFYTDPQHSDDPLGAKHRLYKNVRNKQKLILK